MVFDRTRRMSGTRQAAESAFKAATTRPPEPTANPAPNRLPLPSAKELVSIRIDRDVLEHFQAAGPGWEKRINDALRMAAKE